MTWFREYVAKFREEYRSPHAHRGDWMITFSGVQYYPTVPRAADVRIVDIAHHLSMLCRFTGAVRKFYSVAEHSVHVSYCVPHEHALTGLLHDATESYVNDLSRPLKRSLPDYRAIEHLNWVAICEKFALPVAMPQCIHDADNAVLNAERDALMPPMSTAQLAEWPQCEWVAPVTIMALPPNGAEALFLQRYTELTRGRGAVALSFPNRPIVPRKDAVFA